MNTENTVIFLLKSKEFENYEQEFKKLVNIGNEFQYLERKYIEEFEEYQKIIEDLEDKKYEIWESLNLTEDSDEGIGESIKSQNLEIQPSTSGYKPNSPQI